MTTDGGFRTIATISNSESVDTRIGHGLVVRFFLSVSLVLLLLSAFGPALDHHFAERIPHHAHSFMGTGDLAHEHAFEAVHMHKHPLAKASVSFEREVRFSNDDRILFLTPDDGLGQTLSPMPLNSDPASWVLPAPSSVVQDFAFTRENKSPESRTVQPAGRPPQI